MSCPCHSKNMGGCHALGLCLQAIIKQRVWDEAFDDVVAQWKAASRASKVVVSQTFFSFYPEVPGNSWSKFDGQAYFCRWVGEKPPTRQRFCPKKLHSSQSDSGHDSVSHHFLGYVWKPSAWTFPELKECELHGCWGVVVMLSGRGPQDTATTISATTVWGGLHGVFSCGYSWETMSINAVYYIMYIIKLIL